MPRQPVSRRMTPVARFDRRARRDRPDHAARRSHQPVLARPVSLLAALLVLVAACSPSGGSPGPTPGPTIIPGQTILPGPSGGGTLGPADLRLLLIDTFGPRWYCDPDEYPVSHGTEQERAIERYPEMVAENELYRAIADRLDIDPDGALTDAEKLAIYRQWKVALSLELPAIGDGRYRFDYLAQPAGAAIEGTRTAGIVDDRGQITIEQQQPAGEPMCPICLVRGTLIDTPDGPIAVERLRIGDRIWTLDALGNRVAGTVVALGSTQAPRDHEVVRMRLTDGRSVTASPGHPLADGRSIGDLRIGDVVDGSTIVDVERLPYGDGRTYDLIASGATGAYFAGGIPLGSTLVR